MPYSLSWHPLPRLVPDQYIALDPPRALAHRDPVDPGEVRRRQRDRCDSDSPSVGSEREAARGVDEEQEKGRDPVEKRAEVKRLSVVRRDEANGRDKEEDNTRGQRRCRARGK